MIQPLAGSLSQLPFFLGKAAPDVVYAYLDPGTGSLMLQALIGGIAAALFVARQYWGKIKGFFSTRFTRRDGSANDKMSG